MKRIVKSCLPPKRGKGWTLLLECGHTLYDIHSKKRPKTAACGLCGKGSR